MTNDAEHSVLELWLVRHGETTWNALGRWQGHANAPLSEAGMLQAHRLAARLGDQRFDAVISSDLSRASDTAKIVAAKLEGAPNVLLEPLWREIDVGDLSGIKQDPSGRQALIEEGIIDHPIREDDGVPEATMMVQKLVEGHEAVARTARDAFRIANAADDQPTCDLLTQRLQIHEKTAWMLRSLLE